MRLADCSDKESVLLVALVAICAAHPTGIPAVTLKTGLSRYIQPIAELRSTYFNIAGRRAARRHRASLPFGRGSVPTRTIRATERYGR